MTSPIDIRQVEKKTWAAVFEDGFRDMGVGLMLVSVGLLLRGRDETAWLPVGMAVSLLAIATILVPKRIITWPRVGRVEPRSTPSGSPGKKALFLLFFFTAWLLMCAPLMLWFGPLTRSSQAVAGVTMAAGWLIFGTTLGYFHAQRLMYAYGLLAALSLILATSMESPGEVLVWAAGGVIVAIGLARTIRFMRKYPKAATEDADGQGPV